MSKRPIERRPHGPINQAFSPMFWSAALNRVVFTKPSRPHVIIREWFKGSERHHIEIIPPGPYVDPHQRGAIA